MGRYYDTDGSIIETDDAYARGLGLQPVSAGEQAALYDQAAAEQRQADVAEGAGTTALRRFAGGLSLGLTDVATGAMVNPATREGIIAGEEEHPYVAAGAELAGTLTGALAAPGSAFARTPAGYLARGAGAAFERGVERGGIAGAAQALGAAGVEGAIQSGGSYVGHAAIEDKELTAEGLTAALGGGFAFGAIGGGAALGVEKGTIAARKLFSKLEGKNAALDAEIAWSKQSRDVLDVNDATAKAARDELDNLRAARREAEVEKARADAYVAAEKARAGRVVEETPAVPAEAGPVGETQVAQTSSATPVTWKDFAKARMGEYMKSEGGHAGAMKRLSQEWKARGETPVAQTSSARPANEVAYDAAVQSTPQGATKVSRAPEAVTAPREAEVTKVAQSPLERDLQSMAARAEAGQTLGEMRAAQSSAAAPDQAAVLATAERNRAAIQNIDEAFGFEPLKHPLGNDFAKRQVELESALAEFGAAKDDLLDLVASDATSHLSLMPRSEDLGPGGVPLEFGPRGLAEGTPPAEAGTVAGKRRPSAATPTADRELAADIARGAEVVTRYEKASRKLAEVAGDAAHPASHEFAKAVTAAEDDAARKLMDRTTRAADDVAEIHGPTRLSSKERVAAAKQYKLEATADLKSARANEAAAKAKVDALPKPPKNARPSKEERLGKLGKAEALGAAYELADIPGLPKIHDLPVVGPLLSAWVKFKAVKAALGRFAGRIPATADARAAALAAGVREKVAAHIDRALGLAEKVATKGRQPAIAVGAALSRRIFDDGLGDVSEKASTAEKTAVRVRELSAYVTTPGAIERDVRRELKDVADPDLIAAAEAHQRAVYEHLLATAPPAPPPDPLNKRAWAPSPAEAIKWARRLAAAHDPASVFESLEAGTLTVEQAETLRAAYPRLFGLAQQRVLERAADLQGPLNHRSRTMMTILFDAPLDRALSPESVNIVQSVYGAPNAPAAPAMPAPPAPSIAAGTNLTSLYQTAADRSAAAR